jgi:hypothetical protein
MEQETPRGEYYQLDFFHLLPGSAGGRALRNLRGSEYFAELARNAAAKRSKEERQAIHKKAVKERLRRLYTIPRTVTSLEIGYQRAWRVTERVIPYWPDRATRRRQKPVFVRIELSVQEVAKYQVVEEDDRSN